MKIQTGCGCSTIIMLWVLGFTLLKVTGNAALSWWYVVAPIWWPVWVLAKLVGLIVALVIAIVCVVILVALLKEMSVSSRQKRPSQGETKVIDVQCEFEDEE